MAVGLIWYRPEDYDRVLAVMKDADTLPETYAGWLKEARKAETGIRQQGVLTLRVMVDLDAFLAYCAREGREPVAGTRSHYAALRTQAMMEAPPLPPSATSPFARFLRPPKPGSPA